MASRNKARSASERLVNIARAREHYDTRASRRDIQEWYVRDSTGFTLAPSKGAKDAVPVHSTLYSSLA